MQSSQISNQAATCQQCPRKIRKWCLLRIQSNSAATSNVGAQKLGNDLWHDSETIASFCNRTYGSLQPKWLPMKNQCLKSQLMMWSLGVQFKEFLSSLLLNSDDWAQKLWNYLWHDSESIASFCNIRLQPHWLQMKNQCLKNHTNWL